jgi:hypothetical protein
MLLMLHKSGGISPEIVLPEKFRNVAFGKIELMLVSRRPENLKYGSGTG